MAYTITNPSAVLNSTITIPSGSGKGGTVSITGATGAIGAAGSTILAGSNGTSAMWYDSSVTNQEVLTVRPNALDVKGDATFHGKLTVDGVELGESIRKIEERLGILRPNKELESRWEELKELGERYRELEQSILEKEELIRILSR